MSTSTAEEDRRAVAAYRAKRGKGPFLAADVVVVSGDNHVLLVRRSSPPQRGRFAFPGGFVEHDETFFQAALRELEEETGLGLGNTRAAAQSLRDAPDRDPRARIVSVAFLFRLDARAETLEIRAGGDAGAAAWKVVPGSLEPNDFFADHFDILRAFGLASRHSPR